MTKEAIRVLIVDDSAVNRDVLSSILNFDPSIRVIGTAKNGKEGVAKAKALKPDVITMDLIMPEMTGLEAIGKIMEELPTPIVIVSAMDVKVIMKALGLGAMDFVVITQDIEEIAQDLIEKVKAASKVKPLRRLKIKPRETFKQVKKESIFSVVAIGVSTGGPQALRVILSKLPYDFPAGILIVQHISKGFVEGLADWLRTQSSLDIQVANEGSVLKSTTALLAPDNNHIEINSKGRISLCSLTSETTNHIPSIDVMMRSVASSYKENAIGIIMTGMGQDGVMGMQAIKKSGGITIAQDEKTSAVFGMNKAAIDSGCIDKVIPLEQIADEIMSLVE